jgi:transcriptional regulator GlxA family with amidase domain
MFLPKRARPAGIDCSLHIVSKQFGANVTTRIARTLVVPPHRVAKHKYRVARNGEANDDSMNRIRRIYWRLLGMALFFQPAASHAID